MRRPALLFWSVILTDSARRNPIITKAQIRCHFPRDNLIGPLWVRVGKACPLNGLGLQTGLSAHYSVKGFSGPLTNLALQPNAASPSAWDNAPGRNEKPISAVGGYPGASLAERSS